MDKTELRFEGVKHGLERKSSALIDFRKIIATGEESFFVEAYGGFPQILFCNKTESENHQFGNPPAKNLKQKQGYLFAPKQPLNIRQFQFNPCRPTVVALAGQRCAFHFAQQCVHFVRLQASTGSH